MLVANRSARGNDVATSGSRGPAMLGHTRRLVRGQKLNLGLIIGFDLRGP
jgi:hypothetical protein